MGYLVLSVSAWGVDAELLRSGDDVRVVETDSAIAFLAAGGAERPALLFFPGALIDPDAYAPLLRAVAEAGHSAVLVKLPSLGGRHAMGAGGRWRSVVRGLGVLERAPAGQWWVVSGHSLGGLLAAMVARESPSSMAGLALLGTTHPRDFSLADAPYPVVKVYGTRDGVAPPGRMRANAGNLPASTHWIAIDGGNHSQFGYYGFQINDDRARISREEQHARTLAALLELLREVDGLPADRSAYSPAAPPADSVDGVRLTWLSVTNWLLATDETRVLLDGYLTRVDRRLVEADGSSLGSARTDTAELRRLMAPALPELRLDRILVGHGHWDHAFDVPALGQLTGARIVGSRTVCHQATALGVPAGECGPVEGGEVLDVGPDVRVRVVRWHHSGDPATEAGRRLGMPLELRGPPPLDRTGGLRPGFLEDYPNGGGSRAYLITVRTAGRPITLFWSNSGNPHAWDVPVPVDTAALRATGVDLSNLEPAPAPRSARQALAAALEAEGLDGVDYWIGFPGLDHVRQVVGTLRPRTFVPHHWDDFWSPMDEGPGERFENARLEAFLDSADVHLVVPESYYQRFRLTH